MLFKLIYCPQLFLLDHFKLSSIKKVKMLSREKGKSSNQFSLSLSCTDIVLVIPLFSVSLFFSGDDAADVSFVLVDDESSGEGSKNDFYNSQEL